MAPTYVRLKSFGRLMRDCTFAALLLITCGFFIWTAAMASHKITSIGMDFGRYGQIELLGVIGPQTKVLSFTAVRAPSRVIHVPHFAFIMAVPEGITVSIVYQNRDAVPRIWEQTYYFACDKDGRVCDTLGSLNGLMLCGSGPDGKPSARGWVDLFKPRPYIVPVPPPAWPRPLPDRDHDATKSLRASL